MKSHVRESENAHKLIPRSDRQAAEIIAVFSPRCRTSQELGISATSVPKSSMDANTPARARPAPEFCASVGIIGMSAPSANEKSKVGKKINGIREVKRKGAKTSISDTVQLFTPFRR